MKPLFITLIIFIAVFLLPRSLMGQEVTVYSDTIQYFSVELQNKKKYVGTITYRDLEKITLVTLDGNSFDLLWADISSLQPIDKKEIVDGKAYVYNMQSSRYFYSPNGYGLRAGEAYYQNVMILFNHVSYGFSDYFSVGFSVVPLFLFNFSTPVWITPKVSFPLYKDAVNIGAGTMLGTVIGDNHGFGITYGVLTLGTRDSNIGLAMGYGFSGGSWDNRPTISVNGMLRVSSSTYLITENWITSFSNLFSIGARSMIKTVGIDYGLVLIGGTRYAIPWVGISAQIGKKKN